MYPVAKQKRKIWKRLLIALLILCVAVGIAVFFLFQINAFTLDITLNEPEEIILDYGTPFEDPGAEVHFFGSHVLRDGFAPDVVVETRSNVDTSRVGEYTIRYSADFLWYHAETQRTVHVVDRVTPQIQLTGDPEVAVPYDGEYQEPGYTAFDEYDGDLTDSVTYVLEDGVVTYTVTDTSGNTATATRTIRYVDPYLPEITLNGGEVFQLTYGRAYQEPGFMAWDNLDGNITSSVVVTGSVDPFQLGSYELHYSVTDSSENVCSVIRRVEVVAAEQPQTQVPDGKVIYLTFDDGPGPYTEELLAVLAQYDIQATFFVMNTDYIHLLDDIVQGGHAIGIHTMTHDYEAIYASEEAFFADLFAMEQLIYDQTGVRTTLMRFPGGSSNTVSCFNEGVMSTLVTSVTYAGFQYFDWNVDSDDAGRARTPEKVFENVTTGIGSRSVVVVLQHDIKGYSVEAVEEIIIWGLENGYTFLPLTPTSPTYHHGVNN